MSKEAHIHSLVEQLTQPGIRNNAVQELQEIGDTVVPTLVAKLQEGTLDDYLAYTLVKQLGEGEAIKIANEYQQNLLREMALDYRSESFGASRVIHANCFEWFGRIPENSIHAIVTDPPYGVKEYELDQLEKRDNGSGGIWRIPPEFDGHKRAPLPRFTALREKELNTLREFFAEWAKLATMALRPGGHVFLASNTFLSQMVFSALVEGGLEYRGQIIRIVKTLRGGDRPKNAEKEFSDVSSLPRGSFEPWGLLRKPMLPGMKVSDCLREFQTGGLRRYPNSKPFTDVIPSERTPKREREIADHPSLKPQSFLRQITYVALPLGEGIIADPFMGSGSTVAASEAVGVSCLGVEKNNVFFDISLDAIPKLKALEMNDRQLTQMQLDLE